jgi:hypothetical protein
MLVTAPTPAYIDADIERTPSMHRSGLVAAVTFSILASPLAAEEAIVLIKAQRGELWVTPVEHAECASERTLARGETVLLTGGGFAATEPVRIMMLQGDVEAQIGSTSANAKGWLQFSVVVPMDAKAHERSRLRAIADRGESGNGLVLESALLDISDVGDADDDGVPNLCDNCTEVANPDLGDADDDGLGDACDACPTDPENDGDGDGLCADVDPDPFEAATATAPE